MAADPISPIAPARVRVLVLPAGRIKRQRFMTFFERLQHESTVRLGDISPDSRPDRSRRLALRLKSWVLQLTEYSSHVLTTSISQWSFIILLFDSHASTFESVIDAIRAIPGAYDGRWYCRRRRVRH